MSFYYSVAKQLYLTLKFAALFNFKGREATLS